MIPHLPIRMRALPVFLFLFFSVEAQKIVPTHEDIYAEAEEYMLAGEYKEALPLYLILYERGYTTANLNYKIGECYLNLPGQKDKAIPYLEKVLSKVSASFSGKDLTEENAPLSAYLYLGIAYRLNYKFDKARETYSSMLTRVDTSDYQTRMLLEYHINRCYNAEELILSPAIVKRDLLPQSINNLYSNTNALVLQNEKMMFYMNELKFYDALMQSVKTDEGWQEPLNITPLIKSDGDHIITGISADGNTILLTAYDPYKSGELFSSEFINGKWTPVKKLNRNINTVFNETHASLSADGKTLYFTSDRKGGFGGLDLYKSEMEQGDWGAPVNLGLLINSIFDEETPFLTPDGKKLFFSSQGHYNMGGFDIFYSEWDHEAWLSPSNIGYPVNTPDDDLFYFPLDTGSVAYLSVMDKDTRQTDIYRFTLTKNTNPARYTLKGNVAFESERKINASDIKVTFVEKERKDTIASQMLDKEGKFIQKLPQGDFEVNFANKAGTLIDSRAISIPPFFPQDQLVFNTRISVAGSLRKDTFYLENILFSFDNSSISTLSETYLNTLVELMTRCPEMLLQITGFADALGKEDYNLKLSYHRAMTVADYLKQQNINAGRLTIKGLGESIPVALNSNPDGTDNPDGRKFNRRVELQINVVPENWIIVKKDIIPEYLKSR